MWQILHDWANRWRLKKSAAVLAACLAFVSIETENAFAQDSLQAVVPVDSLPFDQPAENAPAEVPSVESPKEALAVDSTVVDTARQVATTPSANPVLQDKNIKTVLYLSGGERSPWFHLGVLYAIEEFGVPVDSVVGTSWGAWIGALWAKGISPDEIQRLMLDSAIAPYVGHDYSGVSLDSESDSYAWPVSREGVPSLRKRITLSEDAAGNLVLTRKPLDVDTSRTQKVLAKLRLQETLYRQSVQYVRPFALQVCNENASPELSGITVDNIMKSLPLWGSATAEKMQDVPGELCPFYALPAEDRPDELAIVVVADPFRNPVAGDSKNKLLHKMNDERLTNQPGLVIRAHAIQDTSRNAWIQAGFSAMEQRRTSHAVLTNRKVDYSKIRRASAKPWFRYTPSLEYLSPRIHDAVKTYWVDSDTGMTGPRNFVARIQQNPVYDSLNFSMLPSGDLKIESASLLTVDVAAGGFGSNYFGANAYAEANLRYVDHIEMQLILAGFWGNTSYGFQPKLQISKLFSRHWNLSLGYDYLKLHPLKSYSNNIRRSLRSDYEIRSDLNLVMSYDLDDRQRIAAEFLFGHRSFSLDPTYFKDDEVNTYPVSPMLHYTFSTSDESGWFAQDGLEVNALAGMESIGYSFGIIDLVPIYWKLLLDLQFAFSPKPYLSFVAGAAGGIERYHDDGFGYVYPKSFDYAPLDLAYRLHAGATPWSTEWYDPELSSHEYGLLRASGSLHGKYFGVWLFGAYYHDFENSPLASMGSNKVVLEPALRFAYKSVFVYAGMNRIAEAGSLSDLTKFDDYTYFIRVGNYSF